MKISGLSIGFPSGIWFGVRWSHYQVLESVRFEVSLIVFVVSFTFIYNVWTDDESVPEQFDA